MDDFINRNIMLGEIDITTRNITEEGYYNWKSLEESIKKYGLLKPLHVIQNKFPGRSKQHSISRFYRKYRIQDGNHRIYLLRKLYPSDYKVKVRIYYEVGSTDCFAIEP